MVTCNKPIKCWDLLVRPCVRPAGHTPGFCNPFSKEHPLDFRKDEAKGVKQGANVINPNPQNTRFAS